MPSKSRVIAQHSGSTTDRRLSSLVFGDLGSSGRESGRLLAGVAALSLVGPWVLFGDEIVSESRNEIIGASVVFAAHTAFAFGLLVWALLRRSDTPHQLDYWVITGSVTFSMVRPTASICPVTLIFLIDRATFSDSAHRLPR